MRVAELAFEFGAQLEEELAGRYSPAQIRAMRQPYEERILGLLRDAYRDEDISDTQAFRELVQHLVDLERTLKNRQLPH
jgi:hypothetical protein